MLRLSAGIGVVIAATVLAAGQEQSRPATASNGERASRGAAPEPVARQVHLDAIVTDRQGRPILNLKPSEVEVIENGVEQKIDAVELRAAAGSTADAFPIETGDDEMRAARAPGTRVFGLILDEFHVGSGETSARVREALARFVDEHVRPGDLMAVLKPLDTVTAIRFTRDRESIRRAIERFEGRNGDFAPRTEFEQKYLGSAPEAVRGGRAQIVLAALRAMMMKLGDLEAGRSAIVLVTEGFGRPAPRGRGQRVPDVQGLVRAASRFNVAVYTLNPEVRLKPESTAIGPAAPAPPDGTMLDGLAEQTGGEAVSDGRDLSPALARVSRDLDAYYIVSYTSSHPGDGRFYDVKIRTSRRDAVVRARSGYWAPLRTELLADRTERVLAPVRALRRSPLIQTWLGLAVASDGSRRATFTWEPATNMRAGATAPALVAVKITTPDGTLLFEGDIAAPRSPSRAGRPDAAVFAASGSRIQVDLVISGADGTRLDTASHDFDLPDTGRADPMILPPQILPASSAREFRELLADEQAAPVAGRTFRRTERLLLRVPAYSDSSAPIQIAARLLNRQGQVLRDLDRLPGGPSGLTQFDLPLAPFAAGEYSIELTATTATRTARELVRFKLTS